MKINDKLLKPIEETTYLHVENTERYRIIVRYFYTQYENLQYWMYREELYNIVKETNLFEDYTMEKCQSDLQKLAQWGNLLYVQDTSKAASLEEFQNRQYRYRLSPYGVEIERMTILLENLETKGASLSPTLLERIKNQILQVHDLDKKTNVEVSAWWSSLNDDFIRLNRDYQDYISMLNSVKAEEMMKSREFLEFKDKLITYLRTFVKTMQEYSYIIENCLLKVKPEQLETIFHQIVAYELSIPRLDAIPLKEDLMEQCHLKWQSIYRWFVGENDENEIVRLQNITNEIIRKITRYALSIGEMHHHGANRKEEYRKIASMFEQLESINNCHILSASVFGSEHTTHLKNISQRLTDSIYSGVYQEPAHFQHLDVRTRVQKEKSNRKPPEDFELERRMQKLELEKQMEHTKYIMDTLTKENILNLSSLPPISQEARKIILTWLTKALTNKSKTAKTDSGLIYRVEKEKEGECVLKCSDGDFITPCFKIIFGEDSK
ncbi:TIGR02677 family protein [Tannockella kyphosi]|uniref:TIGR02677 family protein n=1 Tax=Tannockella kyphosi TaxID=2899121 RepID=UPI002013658B|nr:TIGR02677 family protein [Tannockella kyphosi]